MNRLFSEAQDGDIGLQFTELVDWTPAAADHSVMSNQQKTAMAVAKSAVFVHTHATVRGMHFRTEKADKHKVFQDSGVAATSSSESMGSVQHVTWFGVIQRILDVSFRGMCNKVFFEVNWFDSSIVQEDPDCRGVELIRSIGSHAHDFQLDTNAFVAAENIDQQVFFAQLPSNTAHDQGSQPWKWVFRDITSSFTIAEHLFDEQGQLVDVSLEMYSKQSNSVCNDGHVLTFPTQLLCANMLKPVTTS